MDNNKKPDNSRRGEVDANSGTPAVSISDIAFGRCYIVEYRTEGTLIPPSIRERNTLITDDENDGTGRIIGRATGVALSTGNDSVIFDCSYDMHSGIVEIPLRNILRIRRAEDLDYAVAFMLSTIGKIVVKRTGFKEESPGFFVNFYPKDAEAVPLPLIEAEVVEEGGEMNDTPVFRLRTYVSDKRDGVNEDGTPYEGKVSYDSGAIDNVTLSMKDIGEFVRRHNPDSTPPMWEKKEG